jgi:diacylglycerol kinase family enzyme
MLYIADGRSRGLENPIEFLSPKLRRIVVSVNPKAGADSPDARVERLVSLLCQRQFEVDVLTDLDDVASQSNRLFAAGRLRALIAVGGDGTAAELVNRTGPGVPLTVFPAGNENLLARYFGLGSTPEECCRIVAEGAMVRRDAGRANDRVFLIMVGCGFDAEVVHSLHLHRTGHVTSASYFNPLVESIRHYDYPELRVYWSEDGATETDGASQHEPSHSSETISDSVRWLFAFNFPCYGAGLQIAPEADGADGLLDICTFRHGGLWRGLYYTAAVLSGTHHWLTDFTRRRAGWFRVTSDAKVPYQLDGDPGGFLPVEIEVLPKRLTLIVPIEKAAT